MSTFEPNTFGTQVSKDETDPIIYPTPSDEERECVHGIPSQRDCAMCIAEKEQAERDKQQAEEIKKREEDTL